MPNPLNDILTDIDTMLNASASNFSQVEHYEGEFEDIESASITPPAAFYEIGLGQTISENYLVMDMTMNIYLCVNTSSIYTILWTIINEFHGAELDDYISFFTNFARLEIYPGYCVYKVSFLLTYEPGA